MKTRKLRVKKCNKAMQIKQGFHTYLPVLAVSAGVVGGYVPQAWADMLPDGSCDLAHR
jgi:hypothetical protein